MNEYGEPWRVVGLCHHHATTGAKMVTDIGRYVRCVNALSGVPDDVVENGLAAIIEWRLGQDMAAMNKTRDRPIITEDDAKDMPCPFPGSEPDL